MDWSPDIVLLPFAPKRSIVHSFSADEWLVVLFI
ncbi:MAG: hypothetical protein ACI95K_001647, partial [Lentimonas sp.]